MPLLIQTLQETAFITFICILSVSLYFSKVKNTFLHIPQLRSLGSEHRVRHYTASLEQSVLKRPTVAAQQFWGLNHQPSSHQPRTI